MSKETERAIEYFEKKKDETLYKVNLGFGDYGDMESVGFIDLAITALKQVEAAKEYCNLVTETADSLAIPVSTSTVKRILDILEGKQV